MRITIGNRIRYAGLIFSLAIGGGTARAQIGSAAHPFPNSSGQIMIFTDQLPSQPSTGQWNFIASHYVGTQKELLSWTQQVRQINPNFIVLHYQLAVGCGTALCIDGNSWTNDFSSVEQNPSWFLDDGTSWIEQMSWDWYVMNIEFAGGEPVSGFPSYWTAAAIKRLNDNQNDGVFADSYTVDALFGQVSPAYSWFNNVTTCLNNWIPNLNAYGAYCASTLHAQPPAFYYLPNLGALITSWDTTNYGVGDGGMNEGFAIPGSSGSYALGDWQLQMGRILNLTSQGKIVIGQSYIAGNNFDQRWFVVGSHLLTKGQHSYLNMFKNNSLEWYPEYTVDLGAYDAPPVADLSEYWNSNWGVYQRLVRQRDGIGKPRHEGGDDQSRRHLRARHGVQGRAVPSNGSQPGSLSTSTVTTVKIPAIAPACFSIESRLGAILAAVSFWLQPKHPEYIEYHPATPYVY